MMTEKEQILLTHLVSGVSLAGHTNSTAVQRTRVDLVNVLLTLTLDSMAGTKAIGTD